MDIFKLCSNFQLLNRLLTILLHLCCSLAPPRLVHASAFKHSDLSWNFHAENWWCSCKLLYKLKLFSTFLLFLSFCRKRISPFKSASACVKKTVKCIFLLSGNPQFVQMLAIALASTMASRTQPKQLGRISIQSFCSSYAHSIFVTPLAHVALSLLPLAAHTNRCPFDQGMFHPLWWWCHGPFRNPWLLLSSGPARGNIVCLLLLVCAQRLRHHISDVAETRRLAGLELEG